MEIIGASIKGMYRDILKGPDSNLIYDSGWRTNTILLRCHIMLAGLMSNAPSNGIEFLAVGQGEESWDTEGIPPVEPDAVNLVSRFPDPVTDLELVYLDETYEVVDGPTSRLQVTATLEPGYPPPVSRVLSTYPLREFGLFGHLNETEYMINNIRHPVIHKDAFATLIRIIRLWF